MWFCYIRVPHDCYCKLLKEFLRNLWITQKLYVLVVIMWFCYIPLYVLLLMRFKIYPHAFKLTDVWTLAKLMFVCLIYFGGGGVKESYWFTLFSQVDRTYSISLVSPPTSYFLKQAAGIKKAAMKPGIERFLLRIY